MQNHRALIQDVRGCMTQFLHLTPEIVEREATDGLTYDEMKRTLEECGMCIEKVLYDPSRRFYNAFYADFVNGPLLHDSVPESESLGRFMQHNRPYQARRHQPKAPREGLARVLSDGCPAAYADL